ncbi:MAG TPA: hypothetical protein VFN61_06635 [Acidimicrobiales bacterium]|nr:hypothetical protein [Acidimicrobiales bacterium]
MTEPGVQPEDQGTINPAVPAGAGTTTLTGKAKMLVEHLHLRWAAPLLLAFVACAAIYAAVSAVVRAIQLPSSDRALVDQIYGARIVKYEMRLDFTFHALRAAVFFLSLGLIGAVAIAGCTTLCIRLRRGSSMPGGSRATLPHLLLTALVLAAPISGAIASGGPRPTNGAAQNGPPGPPATWYEDGFLSAKLSAAPGAVFSYHSATCVTGTLCMAWGQSPDPRLTVAAVSRDGGATWHTVGTATTDGIFGMLGCWDSAHCIMPGTPPEMTSDGGLHWSPVRGLRHITRLVTSACPARDDCVGIADTPGLQWGERVFVTRDGAAKWRQAALPRGAWHLLGLICTDELDCVASGSVRKGGGATGALLVSHDGGRHWSTPAIPLNGRTIAAVACATRLRCAVGASAPTTAASQRAPQPEVLVTTDGAQSWRRTSPLPRFRSSSDHGASDTLSLACTSTRCIAIEAVLSMNEPSIRQLVLDGDLSWRPGELSYACFRLAAIDGLTCTRSGVCLLVGRGPDGGAILYSHDSGTTWHVSKQLGLLRQ